MADSSLLSHSQEARRARWRPRRCSSPPPPQLAAIVVGRDASKLRKPLLLGLCFAWRYRSPYWKKKERGAAAAAPAVPPAAPQALALTPAPSRTPSRPLDGFRLVLVGSLSAFTSIKAAFMVTMAVAREPQAPLTLLPPAMLLQVAGMCRMRVAQLDADAARLGAAAAAAEAAEEDGGSAEPGMELAESRLEMLDHILLSNEACLAGLSDTVLAGLSSADRAHCCDQRAAITPLYALACRMHAELAALRRARPPRAVLLSAASDVCTVVSTVHSTMCQRAEARAALSRSTPPPAGLSPHISRMVDEAVRLGCRSGVSPSFFHGLLLSTGMAR